MENEVKAALKKKKWDVIQHLSEIVSQGEEGRRYGGWRDPKVSNAILFLEALGMIQRRNTIGVYYKITPLGREILKAHVTKALIGEESE